SNPSSLSSVAASSIGAIASSGLAPPAPPASGSEVPLSDKAEPPPTEPPPVVDPKWVDLKSPMVGTFYRSPAPDESPFVEVGDRVRLGQTVCIIEAMKLMNEIEAEVSGQVMEILIENGDPIEYGQALMRINPG
ncbi:acetyl-CoA carboxylase biotin carboxyl carrier protein, partial [Coleofasciculus sp. LEGE 07092]|uniref:acetyl-CoA carboxylase biotin carboxyl carrier protein n=2 Tax=unclassified Coleofasciculus TaxID=2692782 RepID=UPI00188171CD